MVMQAGYKALAFEELYFIIITNLTETWIGTIVDRRSAPSLDLLGTAFVHSHSQDGRMFHLRAQRRYHPISCSIFGLNLGSNSPRKGEPTYRSKYISYFFLASKPWSELLLLQQQRKEKKGDPEEK